MEKPKRISQGGPAAHSQPHEKHGSSWEVAEGCSKELHLLQCGCETATSDYLSSALTLSVSLAVVRQGEPESLCWLSLARSAGMVALSHPRHSSLRQDFPKLTYSSCSFDGLSPSSTQQARRVCVSDAYLCNPAQGSCPSPYNMRPYSPLHNRGHRWSGHATSL